MRCHKGFGLIVALLGWASQAQAQTNYCVGSVAQLQTALDQAELDATDSVIQVRSGVYAVSSSLSYNPDLEFFLAAGKLTIRGGYNSDCSSFSNDTNATRFNGDGSRSLALTTQTGSVSIAGITFNGVHVAMISQVLGLCAGGQPKFTLRRSRIDLASAGFTSQCHDVLIDNVLFTNGVGRPGAGLAGNASLDVSVADYENEEIGSTTVINSTVINGLSTFESCCDVTGAASLYNNIFDISGTDVIVQRGVLFAYYNRYDSLDLQSGASLSPASSNNTAAAPNLNGQFLPNLGSPMLNSGTADVPGGLSDLDQAGRDRTVGVQVDRGALEAIVDGSNPVITVTNTSASGSGSLVEAVNLANLDPGWNAISFNIPGSCPHRINLSAPLDIQEELAIAGTNQPGYQSNTSELGYNGAPCIILDGNGTAGTGIRTMSGIGTGDLRVYGLAFEGFSAAILLLFGQDHAIYANQFGGRVGTSGPVLTGNTDAIIIGGTVGRSLIGGQTASTRNMIGGSSASGIAIQGVAADGNDIVNNLIGYDKNGATPLPNLDGIRISTSGNDLRENRIGGNTRHGVVLRTDNAFGNLLTDNFIGGSSLSPGNGSVGVLIEDEAFSNVIGPGNTIGYNEDSGVRVLSTSGGHNLIRSNRITRNDAPGIDLGANGVTLNDFDPPLCESLTMGCAANRGQNFPRITEAIRVRSGVTPQDRPVKIEGTLTSSLGTYNVEFFASTSCDASDHGQGTTPIGSTTVTITNSGLCEFGTGGVNCSASFTAYFPLFLVDVGDVVTATATSAGSDTSEFSECRTVIDDLADNVFRNGFE